MERGTSVLSQYGTEEVLLKDNANRIERLAKDGTLPPGDLIELLRTVGHEGEKQTHRVPWMKCTEDEAALYEAALSVREKIYGREVYLRGLIEFTNYCRNDCRYCGIRRSNRELDRYRLSEEEILACCRQGHALGFRTFVLQGGEDMHYTTEDICRLLSQIKGKFPDCAVTLSIGERSRSDYAAFREAGAERYLLRQETSDPSHYRYLHPEPLTIENRKRCLDDLKDLGYQVGCGIMIGSPGQTWANIAEDLYYMRAFGPQMIGIGPFIPHRDTPFKDAPAGTLEDTLHLLAVIRLMVPHVLLPATTALGTIHPFGREMGILAGANVVMPNLSPTGVRDKYLLYDGKICTGDEAAECRGCMERRIALTGYEVMMSRGDPR